MKQTAHKNLISIAWSVSIILLLVVGFSASGGGAALVIDPSGKSIGLPAAGLRDTMFDDFKLPGFILFFAVGFLSLLASVFTMLKHAVYPTLIFCQGAILAGWILVQVYLLPESHYLQLIYFIIGLLLMLLGNFQRSKRAL
jgi:hypothetical protein